MLSDHSMFIQCPIDQNEINTVRSNPDWFTPIVRPIVIHQFVSGLSWSEQSAVDNQTNQSLTKKTSEKSFFGPISFLPINTRLTTVKPTDVGQSASDPKGLDQSQSDLSASDQQGLNQLRISIWPISFQTITVILHRIRTISFRPTRVRTIPLSPNSIRPNDPKHDFITNGFRSTTLWSTYLRPSAVTP